jgi:hypothetical protein
MSASPLPGNLLETLSSFHLYPIALVFTCIGAFTALEILVYFALRIWSGTYTAYYECLTKCDEAKTRFLTSRKR